MVAERNGIVHRAEREGVVRSTFDIEEVRDASRSENQVVITQAATIGDDALSREIELHQFSLPKLDQRLSAKETPDGVGDLSRAELSGGDLVEQRKERVVVVSVEHRHRESMPDEAPSRPETAEARPDNDDARM